MSSSHTIGPIVLGVCVGGGVGAELMVGEVRSLVCVCGGETHFRGASLIQTI